MEKEQLIANVLAYIDNLYAARPQPPQSRAIFGDNRMGVEEPPKERWKPEVLHKYYFIDSLLGVVDETFMVATWDVERQMVGNCFPTKEAAEAARDKVKALLLSL